MEKLPVLIKQPNKRYSVGVNFTKKGKADIFAFCVTDKQEFTIHQCGTIYNNFETEQQRNEWFEQQCNTLSSFFNAPIIKEYNWGNTKTTDEFQRLPKDYVRMDKIPWPIPSTDKIYKMIREHFNDNPQ